MCSVPAQTAASPHLFQLKMKKLQEKSKLESLEDLEKIIQLKKKKKCRKVKAPLLKEPEPEVIVSSAVSSFGKEPTSFCATCIHLLHIFLH